VLIETQMNPDDQPRIAIIGGGLSGLATAVQIHLDDPSVQLALFESTQRCGGVINTEYVDPFLIDHGADMFATNPPAAIRL
jgi:oxygen-dependent protoporphyrinogen oxidase